MQRSRSGSGDTGAALDVASAAVVGKREVSFAPPILSAGGVVNSVESVVVEMAEIGDSVKAAVLPNTPNALSAGRRCAQQGFALCMEAVGGQAGDLGTRRDADRVHHGRAFRADRSQDQGATEGGTCCGVGCCRFRRHFSHQ